MRTFGKKTVEIEYTKSLNCDMCGANCAAFDDFVGENYATLQADWGYGSYRDWETDRKSTRLNSSH